MSCSSIERTSPYAIGLPTYGPPGTSLEQQGPDPAKDAFRRHVAPILAARGDLWPGLASEVTTDGAAAVEQVSEERGTGLSTFVRAAALVQSRAFHLEAENWVSGSSEVSY